VLVRLTDIRGVNLDVFDFDYDLVWAGLFLNADEKVYGRYGGRDAESPDRDLSLEGLRHAMNRALAAHRRAPAEKPLSALRPPRTVEQYPAARRFKDNACVHCHQVYDAHRAQRQAAGQWHTDEVWVYPQPANLGLILERDQGDVVKAVLPKSPAAQLGLKKGDVLELVNGLPVASIADVQYALHGAPAQGRLLIVWRHDSEQKMGELLLPEGWRKTDISWRASMRRVGPPPCVRGDDLTADEKKALGLSAKALAFRQGNYVSETARQAGIRRNDIILGVDDKALEMTAGQFLVYIRLTYRVGDRITYNLIRNGKRLKVPLTLPSPALY
jgi:hypothetical protein